MIPTIHNTECCSLVHIRARDASTSKQIKAALNEVKCNGKHAAFVITKPDELTLVETLRGLEFAPVTEFKRCNHVGMLTMWIKRW